MPSASERIATIVNPGFFPNIRNPYRASSTKSSSHRHPHAPLVASFTNSIFPNSRRAARSASFAASPRSSRSRAAIARWLLNSSSSSPSRLLRRQKLTGHLCISLLPYFLTSLLPCFVASSLLLRLQHSRDRIGKLRPSRTFLAQLFLSSGRQPVKLCPLLVFGDSPFRRNPFLFFESVQRRIKRTRIHLQQLAGTVPNRHADPIAMLRSPLQGLQNQQVQRPLQKLNPVLVPLSLFGHSSVPQSIPCHPYRLPQAFLP